MMTDNQVKSVKIQSFYLKDFCSSHDSVCSEFQFKKYVSSIAFETWF